jgi:hypothetical protein
VINKKSSKQAKSVEVNILVVTKGAYVKKEKERLSFMRRL